MEHLTMSKNKDLKITKAMQQALSSWVALNENINKFTEQELRKMLKYELVNEARSAFIRRIKQKIIVPRSPLLYYMLVSYVYLI